MTGHLITVDLGTVDHPAHIRLDKHSGQLWHTTIDRATIFPTVDDAEWHLAELAHMTPTGIIKIIEVES